MISYCKLITLSCVLVSVLGKPLVAADKAPANDRIVEQRMLETTLARSSESRAAKAAACKRLAIVGDGTAVPYLAELLPDTELSSWARIALEAIPGPEADEALRAATANLQGRLLVGVINSLGVRRDAKAVELLIGRLKDDDNDVAAAAAVALGHIGGESAVAALRQAVSSGPKEARAAAAEGVILCAERCLAARNTA
jgi:HEAT repeat protein